VTGNDTMPAPMTSADMQAYIDRHGISARLIRNLGDTRTVPLAAQALGVAAERIVKSLLFSAGHLLR